MSDLTERLAPFAQHVAHVQDPDDGKSRLRVDRRTRWGNRHVMRDQSPEERLRVVAAFAKDVRDMAPIAREALLAPIRAHLAAGGVLACHCAPNWPCHAQVWAAFALAPSEPIAFRPGMRVRVEIPWLPGCALHEDMVDTRGQVGVVDKIRPDRDHPIAVVFYSLPTPPFGEAWTDSFMASELLVVE